MSIVEFDAMLNEKREFFKNAVVKMVTQKESRNLSDTLDYSDFHTVQAKYALVWLPALGTAGRYYLHAQNIEGLQTKVATILDANSGMGKAYETALNLPAEYQFAWVDCTNQLSWRTAISRDAEIDAFSAVVPFTLQLIEAYIAYCEYVDVKHAELIAEKQARLARIAEQEQKQHAEALADQNLKHMLEIEFTRRGCKKGVSVNTPRGAAKISWTGVQKYRGKWNARVGVRFNGQMEFFGLDQVSVQT